MSARPTSVILMSFAAISLLAGPAHSQGARLEGAVLDQSGAAIAGCHIFAVLNDPKKPVETATDNGGVFVFQYLPSGRYTLTVQADGFRTEIRSGVVVQGGLTGFQRFQLQPVSAGASITTEIKAVLPNAQPAVAGNVASPETLALPEIERRPTHLAAYQPGVQVEGGAEEYSRVNGTRQATSNLRIDGLDANDALTPRFGLSPLALNTDSVASFQVVTGVAGAVSGPGTSHVEMGTLSGGNRWSGNVFDNFRNRSLNANDFFNNAADVDQSAFDQNLFGLSLGGPVIRNRTFAFVNYQGRLTNQDVVRDRTVLTSETKSGIFRWYTPNTGNLQSYNIAKNDKRKIGIDSQVSALLAKLPDYNNTDIGDELNTAGYRFNSPTDSYDHQATFRLDHALTRSHRLFYSMNWDKNHAVDAAGGNEARFPGEQKGTEEAHSYSHAVGSDWIISPKWTNQLRVGFRRGWLDSERPARESGAMLLSNTWTDPLNPAFAKARDNQVLQANDFIASQRGRHFFRLGGEFTYTRLNSSADEGTYPNVTFACANGNTPSGNIGPVGTSVISSADRQQFERLYNDLLGRMDMVTQTFYSDLEEFQDAGSKRVRAYKGRAYNVFAQDDWRLRPNFSLVLGVRYELGSLPYERNGIQATLDQASAISAAAQISDFEIEPTNQWYKRDTNNFAPRFGFAWSPGNSGRTVVRGGYGIFYEHLAGAVTNTVDAYALAFSQTVSAYPNKGGKDVRVSDGIPVLSSRSSPDMTPSVNRANSVAVLDPNLRTGYIQQFNFSLQRQIRNDTVIEVGYVGTRGTKLYMNLDLNQPRIQEDFLAAFKELQAFRSNGTPVSPTNTLVRMFGNANAAIAAIGGSTIDQGQAGAAADTVDKQYYSRYRGAGLTSFYLRNFPQFDQLVYGTNAGRSWYDSLQVAVRHRHQGLMLNANYIWGKSIDNTSAEGDGFSSPIDSFDLSLNKARSDFHRPHMFNASAIYTLPIGKGHTILGAAPRWLDAVFGGWDAGVLFLYEAGKPFSISSGRRTAGANTTTYADYSGDGATGQIYRADDSIYYFSVDSAEEFTFPEAGTTGTSGRNSFLGPRYFNIDMSLTKRFRLNETRRIALRLEAYNLLNHANFGLPEANLVNPSSFGQISSTQGTPRNLQVAVRFEF